MVKSSNSKKKRTLRIILLGSAALALLLVLLLASAMRPQRLPAIGTAVAAQGPLDDLVSASGVLKAKASASMASRVAGRVKSVRAKAGDRVALGQLLVVLDDEAARLALSNAQVSLEETRRSVLNQLSELRSASRRAQTAKAQALRSLENAKELKAVEGISAEAWRQAAESAAQSEEAADAATESLRLAEGLPPSEAPVMDSSRDKEFLEASPAFKRASIALENARRDLEACSIASDAAGTLVELSVDPGAYVPAGGPIARVEDLSAVTAEVNVDEVDIGKIAPGQSATISADSLFGKELAGRVSAVKPVVKSTGSGRICVVVIDVDLGGERALSGATCVARVSSRVKDSALVIPASALIPGASPPAVWLLALSPPAGAKKAKAPKAAGLLYASRREVKVGASTASKLEILSGLSAGDRVAVDGLKGLAEGAPAKDRAEGK